MSNYSDKTTVSIFVNGESAEQALARLTEKANKTADALSAAMEAGDKKAANKLQKELDKVTKEINKTESAAKGCGKVMSDLSNTSIHGLRNALKYLKKELSTTKPNTEQWQDYADKIDMVKKRLKELEGAEEGAEESIWSKISKKAWETWPVIELVSNFGEMASSAMQMSVDAFASMDSEMANVRKFTGMTEEQVAALNAEFKKMDTRTSREALNQLAQEAGRLGKTSQEDVLGFVRAANQINVALDDLGEGATLTLSKLTGVFGDEAKYGTEQALLKVGSVINELSQNCAAGAPFLAEFASRMGGVGAQANMTIPQIMAYGAVLDSAGMNVEASSTALSQVIVRFMQEPAKYAKVAGMDVKKFSNLLKTDVNGAVVMFLETLNKAGGIDNLSPMFKDMGETGSQAIATLSTLATHVDQVKAQQIAANKAFEEGTSIGKEYDVQNTTVQASLDKMTKSANELQVELGQQLAPVMTYALNYTAAMSKAVVTLVRFLMQHKGEIASLTAGIAAYIVVMNLAVIKTTALTMGTKLLNAALAIEKGVITLTSAAFSLLTGNIGKARTMMALFNTTIKANPIGLLVSVVTSAIVAIGSWVSKSNEAIKAAREAAKEKARVEREFRDEISNTSQLASDLASKELDRLKTLYNATQDTTKSQKERIAAVHELQKTYPTAFGNLSQEAILTGKASTAYKNLAQNILKAAKAKAIADKIQENEKKLLKLDLERESLEEGIVSDSNALEKEKERKAMLARAMSRRNQNKAFKPSKYERQRLDNSKERISALEDGLDAKSEKLEANMMKQSQINETNQKLSEKLNVDDLQAFSFEEAPAVVPQGGYTSQIVARKEKAKQDAEKRRADAKAKKEFKNDLEAVTAAKISGETSLRKDMEDGNIDYEKALERRHEIETTYYDQALSVYEKHMKGKAGMMLEEDKEYQDLLLKKQKSDEDYEKRKRDLEIQGIKRRALDEENAVRFQYEKMGDVSLEGEVEMQAQLFAIRAGALQEQAQLYAEGSKERADIELEIDALYKETQMEREKLYLATVNKLRNEYDKKSAAERLKLEKATLDALLKAKKISEEEYQRILKSLRDKYNKEDDAERSEASDGSNDKADRYDERLKVLQDKYKMELLTHEEFLKKKAELDKEYSNKGLEGLKKNSGEWNAMLAEIYTSFAKLVDGLGEDNGKTLENLAGATKALSSAVVAGMQIATEFAKAEAEIQTKTVEKRYAREIELAQGNSYKTATLEKQKQAELAKIKSEASKKQFAMQVIQAVAQTASNALAAYGSALAVPAIGYILAPIAATMATAQGLVQVALLKKQQQAAEAQGYSKGGFTKPGGVNEPAGIVHAGEWVASQKLLASPVARPMIDALDYVQRTNTIGLLSASDVSRSIRATDTVARASEGDGSMAMIAAVVSQNAEAVNALNERLKSPIASVVTVTGDHGINKAQSDAARYMNNITPKSKQK